MSQKQACHAQRISLVHPSQREFQSPADAAETTVKTHQLTEAITVISFEIIAPLDFMNDNFISFFAALTCRRTQQVRKIRTCAFLNGLACSVLH